MLKIINEEDFFNDCQTFIDHEILNHEILLTECLKLKSVLGKKLLDFVMKEKLIKQLILDEDKLNLEVNLSCNLINNDYYISIGRTIDDVLVKIFNIEFNAITIKEMIDCIAKNEFKIIFYALVKTGDSVSEMRFYRNNIANLKEANLMRMRYNLLKHTLNIFKIRFDFGLNEALDLRYKKVDSQTKLDKDFFEKFLMNTRYPDANEDFLEKILSLDGLDLLVEVFWTYNKEKLVNLNFKDKESFYEFCSKIEDIKNKFSQFGIYVEFDFLSSLMRLAIDNTSGRSFIRLYFNIEKYETCESLLNRELYLYQFLKDALKIDGLFFKDYVNNPNEVLKVLNLMTY